MKECIVIIKKLAKKNNEIKKLYIEFSANLLTEEELVTYTLKLIAIKLDEYEEEEVKMDIMTW